MSKLREVNEELIRRSNETYSSAATTHGTSSSAVLADRHVRQMLRFTELVQFIDLNDSGASVLEVGCGNAELFKYLSGRGFRGNYVGVDINEPLLEQARARFPGIDVRRADILSEDLGRRFDYVLMSGVLNVDFGQDQDWVDAFLRKMYELSEQAMAFNALSTHVNFRTPGFCYYDPADMLRFCIENLSRRVTLAHHHLSYNYSVAVFRAQGVQLECPE